MWRVLLILLSGACLLGPCQLQRKRRGGLAVAKDILSSAPHTLLGGVEKRRGICPQRLPIRRVHRMKRRGGGRGGRRGSKNPIVASRDSRSRLLLLFSAPMRRGPHCVTQGTDVAPSVARQRGYEKLIWRLADSVAVATKSKMGRRRSPPRLLLVRRGRRSISV